MYLYQNSPLALWGAGESKGRPWAEALSQHAACKTSQATPAVHSRMRNWHSSRCHQRTQGGKETQPAVQNPMQNPLTPTGFNTLWMDLNTQKAWEDPEKLKGLTSRREISVWSLLIKLHQATTHVVASTCDHRDVHTLFSTSLYFLILLSLAGPIASVSPTALAFFSLSKHSVKKAIHTQDVQLWYLHTTTHLLLRKRKRLVWGDRNTGLRKKRNTRTIFHVCSYVLVQRTLVNLSTART